MCLSSSVCHLFVPRLARRNLSQDGSAILWREEHLVRETADAAATARTAQTTEEATRETGTASVSPPRGQPVSRNEGGQLVQAAVMRGHSGANVWRLATHEFAPSSSSSDMTHQDEEGNWLGLTLLATGGNDGTCKLWDLDLEGACERRQRSRWETMSTTRENDANCCASVGRNRKNLSVGCLSATHRFW